MSRRSGASRDYEVVHAVPVFAVGGTVSGYGSLGSAESLGSGPDKPVSAAASSAAAGVMQTEAAPSPAQPAPRPAQGFKSAFAKELHQETVQRQRSPASWRQHASYRSSFIDEVIAEDEDSCADSEAAAAREESEYVRVRRENDILKRRLSEYSKEDDKYKKLEFEIEQLTWQLGKMEQSREVYETATTQLGSFLELVSSRLTTKQLPDTANLTNLNHRVSQGHVSHSNVSHSNVSHVSRTSSSATGTRQRRSESEHARRRHSSQRAARLYQLQPLSSDPSLSPSISCGSSSLNTSCASEGDRSSGLGLPASRRRSSGSLVKYRKSDTVMSEISVGGDTVAETEHRDRDAIYGDPCICPPGEQGDGAETGVRSWRGKPRARGAR